MNYNRIMIGGRLTGDPTLRYTASNTPVCNFTLAVNRKTKDREEVAFVDCVAWSACAENINKYMQKGRPLFVEGRITQESWQAKDGSNRSKLVVTVETFQFIDSKRDGGQQGNRPQQPAANDYDPDMGF